MPVIQLSASVAAPAWIRGLPSAFKCTNAMASALKHGGRQLAIAAGARQHARRAHSAWNTVASATVDRYANQTAPLMEVNSSRGSLSIVCANGLGPFHDRREDEVCTPHRIVLADRGQIPTSGRGQRRVACYPS